MGIVLAVALLSVGLMALLSGRSSGSEVRVYLGDALYETLPFGVPAEVRIPQENGGENVVSITTTGVSMKSSTCKNQVCVHSGTITRENLAYRPSGAWIVCLPNRVSVEVRLEEP
ncbi:MAG: NusG domain II-containing protein [Oscillospiraceae bacterium]